MKIEQAYSLDIGDTVDAELAYDYYWAGAISNKQNFECPSVKCSASITCANLDKLRHDMKVDPYFKAVEDHSPDCDLIQNIDHVDTTAEKSQETPKSRAKKSDKLPDIFELSRPKSHFETKEVNSIEPDASPTPIKNKKNKTSISSNAQPSRHYTVRAFVSKYIKHKAEGSLDKHHIDIKGCSVSYREMFVEISLQDIHTLSKRPRIYFGKAFVDAKKGSAYVINFTESFSVEDNLKRPSIYIGKNLLDKAFTKKLSEKKFADLSAKNYPSVWCFVYAVPQLKTINDKLYINFQILNMDFIDLREKI